MNGKPNPRAKVFRLLLVGSLGIAASAALDVARAQNVAGVWDCELPAPTPWGMCRGRTILMPDGTFSRANQCGNLMAGDEGNYKAGEGYVHYDIAKCWPTEYHGKTMHCLKSETVYFRWVDADTLQTQDGVECHRSRYPF